MPVMIALLRGVNLGGHKKITMDTLRDICVSLKHRNPQTYIQSGNVVFVSSETDPAKVAARVESAIEKHCGFSSSVIVRTAADMGQIVAANPFAGRKQLDPARLVVYFLTNALTPDTAQKVQAINVGPEEIRPADRELYIYFPDGQGKSKLPAVLDRTLKMPITARNWNTVLKLLAMAEDAGKTR